MTPAQHQKLAALRRMATHPSTPENERASAKRRIAEMEEKYGRGSGRAVCDVYRYLEEAIRNGSINIGQVHTHADVTSREPWYGSPYTAVHETGGTGIPPRPFVTNPFSRPGVYAGPYEPLHHNARCRTVPIDDNVQFTGRKLSEFADYVVDRWRNSPRVGGSYGNVGEVTRDPKTDDTASFIWACPVCNGKVECKVGWKEAGLARMDSARMDQLLKRLFALWGGDFNNRCDECMRRDAMKKARPMGGNSFKGTVNMGGVVYEVGGINITFEENEDVDFKITFGKEE